MKKKVIAALILFAFSLTGARAQSHSEETLLAQLADGGTNALPALERVLKTPEDVSSTALILSSMLAYQEKRLEDAGFLYYAARLRAHFDKMLFPPVGTGGNNPLLLFGAIESELSPGLSPAITAEPKIYGAVVKRLKSWKPNVATNYEPGWEYTGKTDIKKAEAELADGQKILIARMTDLLTLLQDTDYLAAYRSVQNYNLKVPGDSERPSKDVYDAAVAAMERIEKIKGIEGAATGIRKHDADMAARELLPKSPQSAPDKK